jgi:hypothetical protein
VRTCCCVGFTHAGRGVIDVRSASRRGGMRSCGRRSTQKRGQRVLGAACCGRAGGARHWRTIVDDIGEEAWKHRLSSTNGRGPPRAPPTLAYPTTCTPPQKKGTPISHSAFPTNLERRRGLLRCTCRAVGALSVRHEPPSGASGWQPKRSLHAFSSRPLHGSSARSHSVTIRRVAGPPVVGST